MNEKELKEILTLLEAAGWEPMVCDTPVPYFDNGVMCGTPTEVGDIVEETRMMPKELLAWEPTFMVRARGDSMKDAGIVEDDMVKVEATGQFHDGDIVLASIDGEFTLKTYCEDEAGRPWLVPQNAAYDAFPLAEPQNIWIAGVVRGVIKQAPRISYRLCMKIINKARAKLTEPQGVTPEQVEHAVRTIAPEVTVGRWWYAVFRALADKEVMGAEDYDGFCALVARVVPEHKPLPTIVEMQRLAVQSFSKPVTMWRADNAPVKGKRFKDYLHIAQRTKALLEG